MKKSQVVIGETYRMEIRGTVTIVRVCRVRAKGPGWEGLRIDERRPVTIRTAAKLLCRCDRNGKALDPPPPAKPKPAANPKAAAKPKAAGAGKPKAAAKPKPTRKAKPKAKRRKSGKKPRAAAKPKGRAAAKAPAKASAKKATAPTRAPARPPARPASDAAKIVAAVAKGDLTKGVTIPRGGKRLPTPPGLAKPAAGPTHRKGSALDAAVRVLRAEGKPLSSGVIVDLALKRKLWKTNGKTPAATLYAAIIREIAAHGEASPFRKKGANLFGVTAA